MSRRGPLSANSLSISVPKVHSAERHLRSRNPKLGKFDDRARESASPACAQEGRFCLVTRLNVDSSNASLNDQIHSFASNLSPSISPAECDFLPQRPPSQMPNLPKSTQFPQASCFGCWRVQYSSIEQWAQYIDDLETVNTKYCAVKS